MRKIIAIVLAVFMVFGLLPTMVKAETEQLSQREKINQKANVKIDESSDKLRDLPSGFRRLKFEAEGEGFFPSDPVSGEKQVVSFFVRKGTPIPMDILPVVEGYDGWAFAKWSPMVNDGSLILCRTHKAKFVEVSRKPYDLRQEENTLYAYVGKIVKELCRTRLTKRNDLMEFADVEIVDNNGNRFIDPVTRQPMMIPGTLKMTRGNLPFEITADISKVPHGAWVRVKLSEWSYCNRISCLRKKLKKLSKERVMKKLRPTLSDPIQILRAIPEAPTLDLPDAMEKNDIIIGNLVFKVENGILEEAVQVRMTVGDQEVFLTKEAGAWTCSDEGFEIINATEHEITLRPRNKGDLDKKLVTVWQTNNFGATSEPTSAIAHTLFDTEQVADLTILQAPSKMQYTNGEYFDITGMMVRLTDTFANTMDVDAGSFFIMNIRTEPAGGTVLEKSIHDGMAVRATRDNLSDQTRETISISSITGDPEVLPIHTDDIKIIGEVKGEPGALVSIQYTDEKGPQTNEVYADENGKFVIKVDPVLFPGVFTVIAQGEGKEPSGPLTVKVLPNTKDLIKAIGEGTVAAEKIDMTNLDAMDQELLDAIQAGKDLLVNDADSKSEAKEGVTQIEVDDAAKRIRDAIHAKETEEEKEARRKNLIDKLQAAIERGEAFQAEPGYEDVIEEDKAILDAALVEAKKDLASLKDPDWDNIPDEVKVDADIKAIDDAIAHARKGTDTPTINSIKKGGNEVTGTAEPGATVIIKSLRGSGKVVANPEGTYFFLSKENFQEGDEVFVIAIGRNGKGEDKLPSIEVKATVGVYTEHLIKAIEEGNNLLDNRVDGLTPAEQKLRDAIVEGKALLDDQGNAVDDATQTMVDNAEKKIREAMDLVEADNAVQDIEDRLKDEDPTNDPTEEEIGVAQDLIEKIDGVYFEEEKEDLQEKLDGLKDLKELKDLVEQAEERLTKEDIEDKPFELVDDLKKAKDQGKPIADANGEGSTTGEIKEAIEHLKEALKNIEIDFINISMEQPHVGAVAIQVTTMPKRCHIIVYIDNVEVANLYTDGFGHATIGVPRLKEGQKITIVAEKDGNHKNTIYVKVK